MNHSNVICAVMLTRMEVTGEVECMHEANTHFLECFKKMSALLAILVSYSYSEWVLRMLEYRATPISSFKPLPL